jgi:CRISPR/Cas system-associated exonuclease Cas4 (RecB family)
MYYVKGISAPPTRELFEKTVEHNITEAVVAAGLDKLSKENVLETSTQKAEWMSQFILDDTMSHENYRKIISERSIENDIEALKMKPAEVMNAGRRVAGNISRVCKAIAEWTKEKADDNVMFRYAYEKKFRAIDKELTGKRGIAAKPDFVVAESYDSGWVIYPIEVKSGRERKPYYGEIMQLTAELICVGRNRTKMDELVGGRNWKIGEKAKIIFTDGSMLDVDLSYKKYEDDVWKTSHQIRNIESEFNEGRLRPNYDRCFSCSLAKYTINGKPACDKAKN